MTTELQKMDDTLLQIMEKNPDALVTEVSRIKLEQQERQWQIAHVHASEIGAIRALRTAAIILRDAVSSFQNVGYSSSLDSPEVRDAKSVSWSVVEPFLKELAASVKVLHYSETPLDLEQTMAKCNQLLLADDERISRESCKPLLAQLQSFKAQFRTEDPEAR